jgi:hypothetical protein
MRLRSDRHCPTPEAPHQRDSGKCSGDERDDLRLLESDEHNRFLAQEAQHEPDAAISNGGDKKSQTWIRTNSIAKQPQSKQE